MLIAFFLTIAASQPLGSLLLSGPKFQVAIPMTIQMKPKWLRTNDATRIGLGHRCHLDLPVCPGHQSPTGLNQWNIFRWELNMISFFEMKWQLIWNFGTGLPVGTSMSSQLLELTQYQPSKSSRGQFPPIWWSQSPGAGVVSQSAFASCAMQSRSMRFPTSWPMPPILHRWFAQPFPLQGEGQRSGRSPPVLYGIKRW